MKDDEGGVADVASSVALAEANDVPNDAQPAEKQAELKAADDSSKPIEHDSVATPPTTEEGKSLETEKVETAKEDEVDKKLPKETTNPGEALASAVKPVAPKEGSEHKN